MGIPSLKIDTPKRGIAKIAAGIKPIRVEKLRLTLGLQLSH